jgi:hypothetical protein
MTRISIQRIVKFSNMYKLKGVWTGYMSIEITC